MLLKEIISVLFVKDMKPMSQSTHYGQNAELFKLQAPGTYSYHSTLKG
jgi:hypothetical protein